MKRAGVLLGTFVVIACTVATGCNFVVSSPRDSSTQSPATSASPLEQSFVISIGADVDLNSGIAKVLLE